MKYKGNWPLSGGNKNDIYEVSFMLAMEDTTNLLIKDKMFISIAKLYPGQRGHDVFLFNHTFLTEYKDGVITILGSPGPIGHIDDKPFFLLTDENRNETRCYKLDYGFMDRILIDGAEELITNFRDAEEIIAADWLINSNVNMYIKIIDFFRKKYKMEDCTEV